MKPKPLHVWVDSREPEEVIVAIQNACGLTETHQKFMTSSDIALIDGDGCTVGIERKTTSDLLGSMADGRLSRQLTRLREVFAVPILLIEGNYGLTENKRLKVGQRPTGWHHAAVMMSLYSIQSQGLYVIQTPGLEGTADFVRALRNRGRESCLGWAHAREGLGRASSIVRLVEQDAGPHPGLRPEHTNHVGAPQQRTPPGRDRVDTRPPSLTIGRAEVRPDRRGAKSVHAPAPVHRPGPESGDGLRREHSG